MTLREVGVVKVDAGSGSLGFPDVTEGDFRM